MRWLLLNFLVPFRRKSYAPHQQADGLEAKITEAHSYPENALLEFGSETICVLDEQLGCHYLSPNWYNISGLNVADTLGDEFKKVIAADYHHRISHYLTQPYHAEPVRFQMRLRAGDQRWIELRVLPVPKKENHYSCILRDVSELVTSKAKEEKALLEADLALKSRSEFLANMSHELRTPLNAILGFAQMIESGTYGAIGHPKYSEYINNIQESGSTLLAKISDLIQIANIDTGKLVLMDSRFDLCELIRYALEYHSHHAFSDHVHLRSNLPKEPIFIFADRIRMLQVITNLINNAIKYNHDDGYVRVSCRRSKEGGVVILVEDNGEGIAASHLNSILSAFQHSDSFFARSRDCMGLGLALSKEIIKLHQGRIEIESEAGKGTELSIYLPKERTIREHTAPALKLSELA